MGKSTTKTGRYAVSSRGRPRDPGLEQRVYVAAIEIYSEDGWLGFNFDKVARQAGVGKAALYRRWNSREQLISDALRARWSSQADIDEGSLERDLRVLVEWLMVRLINSNVAANMVADSRRYEDFVEATKSVVDQHIKVFRDLLKKSVQRGEISPKTDLDMIFQMIVGAILLRFGGKLRPLHGKYEVAAFTNEIVAFMLAGLSRLQERHFLVVNGVEAEEKRERTGHEL